MIIIGCDYHPSFQQIAFVDTETGELQERRLQHREEPEKFYRRADSAASPSPGTAGSPARTCSPGGSRAASADGVSSPPTCTSDAPVYAPLKPKPNLHSGAIALPEPESEDAFSVVKPTIFPK